MLWAHSTVHNLYDTTLMVVNVLVWPMHVCDIEIVVWEQYSTALTIWCSLYQRYSTVICGKIVK